MVGAAPHDAGGRAAQLGILARELERLGAEQRCVLVRQRRLVGRAAHVAAQHARVCVVEDRGLDASPEQLVGLAHEELVEAVLARDQHREAAAAAAGASPLLAQRRDRAREADRDHAVEQADVDAELERIRRRDAEQLAVLQPTLDLAPLLRGVAGPVRREVRVVAEPLGGEAVDQLGRLAALRERQGPEPALDEHRLQTRRLGER